MALAVTSMRYISEKTSLAHTAFRRASLRSLRAYSSSSHSSAKDSTEGVGSGNAAGGNGFGVQMWGHGTKGQLGIPKEDVPTKQTITGRLNSEHATTTPTPLLGYEQFGARAVSCGSDFSALVNTEGKLYTFGSNNKKGMLGVGAKNSKDRHKLTEVKALRGVDIASVACGEHHSVAVDKGGVAYSWGYGGSGWEGAGALGLGDLSDVEYIVKSPTEISIMSDVGAKVAKTSAGGSHTVFLTTDGEVWTCGRGEFGLCGNGGTEDQLTPAPLDFFEDQIIVDVQAGNAFSLALTNEGEVFGWGRNDQGQLGLGGGLTMDIYAAEVLPRTIDALVGEKVVSIGAGYQHAAAATESGKLFMWGMKRYLEPEWMSVLKDKKVVYVNCGKSYTIAVTDTGALYTFGSGSTYCLGEGTGGKCQNRAQPEIVPQLAHANVMHVACGASHVAALVKPS